VGPVVTDPDGIRFYCDGGADESSAALAAVVSSGVPVVHFSEETNSLEETFVHLLRGE
jgi:hypothetical protein